jgi:hypothetical protein
MADARYEANRHLIIAAEELGNRHLADANEAAERGKLVKAERLYQKSQYWLDRANELRGWGE